MPAMELLTGYVTAPGSTLTALTMASGNSLTIRNTDEQADIRLLQAWVDSQTAGVLRIRSPQMHDNVQNMRFTTVAGEVDPILPRGFTQKLQTQDTLVVELSGSGTAGDIETACLLVYYDSLPGIEGRFFDAAAVKGAMKNIVTVENTLSLGTGGGYSGEEAINAEYDLFKADTDYAILGYIVSAECAAIRYRGPDFGNLGVGGPGNEVDRQTTSRWFVTLSEENELPLIPVFNSANKNSILIDGVQDENGTDVTVQTILAELG